MKFRRAEYEAHIRGIFLLDECEETRGICRLSYTHTQVHSFRVVVFPRDAPMRNYRARIWGNPGHSFPSACHLRHKYRSRTHSVLRVWKRVHPRCIVPLSLFLFLFLSALPPLALFVRLRQVLREAMSPSGDESLKVTSCTRVRRLARFSSAGAAYPWASSECRALLNRCGRALVMIFTFFRSLRGSIFSYILYQLFSYLDYIPYRLVLELLTSHNICKQIVIYKLANFYFYYIYIISLFYNVYYKLNNYK